MTVRPFASVIVPTCNRSRLLPTCLETLRAQEYPPDRYEIIVVDDGSTDATPDVAAAFCRRPAPPPTRLVRQPHRGLNAARNAGIRAAEGDPICFVDDDVDVPPTWLAAMVDGAERYPAAGCLGGPIRLRLEGRVPKMCSGEPLGETELDLGPMDRMADGVCGANLTVRRWAVERVGLFREDLPLYGEEFEWEHRLLVAGGTIAYVAAAWLVHIRTADELAFRRLLRRRFMRGANGMILCRIAGIPVSLREEAAKIPWQLVHAVHRRCAWGVLAAAQQAGKIYGLARLKLRGGWRPAAAPSPGVPHP